MHSHNGFKSEIFSADTDPTLQFFAAFDMMDHSDLFTAPFRAMAISQLEWFGFLSRRTRAAMHMPSDMARCRTPQDIAEMQKAAIQSAYEDWTRCSQKISAAWTHVAEQTAAASTPDKSKTKQRPRRRDFMMLPAEEEKTPTHGPAASARDEAA